MREVAGAGCDAFPLGSGPALCPPPRPCSAARLAAPTPRPPATIAVRRVGVFSLDIATISMRSCRARRQGADPGHTVARAELSPEREDYSAARAPGVDRPVAAA